MPGKFSGNYPQTDYVQKTFEDIYRRLETLSGSVSRSIQPVVSDSHDAWEAVGRQAQDLKASVEADVQTVVDKADDAWQRADDANTANTKLREDTAKSLETVNTVVSGVRTDVDAVSEKAATLASGLDSANTKITSTSDKLTGLTTTVSNVSQTADSALSLSTQNHQDLTGFQQSVQQTYSTKENTLSQVSAVSQKADSISASLSKDYQKKTDADATYATKTALQATANGITASVSETYATKSVVQALQNIADNAIETWQGHGVPSMTGEPASEWTTGELRKQHSGDMYYDLDTGYSYRFGSADGSTYTWDKISDSDITRAMQAAADAQSDADKANAGVSKLNTDIPATYATKSDVKITTDGIKTDVSKAMTLGQTGVDNAATVDHKADGIITTVSQLATENQDQTKAIAQVNMRADSLSTSITQVNTKTDLALANAQELVRNPNMRSDVSNPDGWPGNVTLGSSGAPSNPPRPFITYAKLTGRDHVASWTLPNIPGRVLQYTIYAVADSTATKLLQFGVQYSDSNGAMRWNKAIMVTVAQGQSGWAKYVGTFTVPDDIGSDTNFLRPWLEIDGGISDTGWYVTGLSIKDITEAKAAQKAADAAQSTADTAVSQASTLSQDLSGFKTTVGQTYETKTDSTAKNTALQQNLDGFKTSVASTYASKTDVANTYATKSDVTQTSDSLTSQISAVGTDATSALNKATTNQQNLDSFKTTVSNTYTKQTDFNTLSGRASQTFGFSGTLGKSQWGKIGTVTMKTAAQSAVIEIHTGSGWNGGSDQNSRVQIMIKRGNDSTDYSNTYGVSVYRENCQNLTVKAMAQSNDVCEIWAYFPWWYWTGNYTISGLYDSWANSSASQDAEPTSGAPQNVAYRLNPEQLKSDVAATYATQSSVQQTSSQITQQVAATYATKDDVTSKYTTLQQTDNAFDARIGTAQSTAANAQSNASNAQNRAGVLETLIHSDANGVRVGKTVNGSYTGYSALVNANGSFDVLNPAGQMVSRFNSDGIQIPSGMVSVNGIPMVEDITDKLVFMNTYWRYRVKATRIFNQVIMQVWCMRHGDPWGGDYVPVMWRRSELFKIKRGYRPYGVPGDENGQDIHFPMANNALSDSANISPAVYVQVTDTFIAIRSPYGNVRFKNDVTWLSGVVSWVIDPDHQTDNDDSASSN